MRDAWAVWRNTRLIVLVALTAGVYAAVLIPFKVFPIQIPNVTEFRPANVLPVVCSLLFGPAAAWGAAFGNLIADFFGTIGPGSAFGFVGNFLLGYLPYRLWLTFSPRRRATGAPDQIPLYLFVTALSAAACGVFIAWGVDLLGLVPYQALSWIIFLNNAIVAAVLGPILLPLVYPLADRWGLLVERVMPEDDWQPGLLAPVLGAPGVVAACVVGLALVKVPLPEHVSLQTAAGACSVLLLVGSFFLARMPRLQARTAPEGRAEPAEHDKIVEVRNVTFHYAAGGREPALRDLSFAQTAGEHVALMGRTGAGKSTLCLTLNGLIPQFLRGHFEGSVRAVGKDTATTPVAELSQDIGLVFQDFETQLFSTAVTSEVAFALENLGTPPTEMARIVPEVLERLGLADCMGRDPAQLSGGEKQRLAIASVLCMQPRLLVLDEPTTDLDPLGRQEVLEATANLRAQGMALLIADHEPEQGRDAERLLVLQHGMVAYDGPPAGLLTDAVRCRELGLRPLDTVELYAALGSPERPLQPEAAVAALRKAGYEVRPNWTRRNSVTEPGELIIDAQEICFTYDGPPALDGVSLQVREGEFLAILGQNGSGKTTLAKQLNGLLRPQQGRVTVGGTPTSDARPADLARTVGYVFQNPDHQIAQRRVDDEVAFGPRNLGMSEREVQEAMAEALAAVELQGREAADPFTLTKGERQRVAVASVLAARPRVVVLDEPTTGLDGPQQQAMLDLLQRLNRAGHTVIMITHSMWAAATYAHRIVLMSHGRILADGSPYDLFARDDLLAQTHLQPPDIVRVARALTGQVFLTPQELAQALHQSGRPNP